MGREFRLAPPGSGRGVSCDAGGAFIGNILLLKRSWADDEWEPRDCRQLSEQIGTEFGLPIDMTSKMGGLNAISRALNKGDIARAQIATVLLGIPDPSTVSGDAVSRDEVAKFVRELGWSGLIKVWEPDLHPRWDAGAPDHQGGRFKEKDLLVADADPEGDDDVEPSVNGQTAEESLRASEIDNRAGAEDDKERAAEAAGQETKEQYRSQVDRVFGALRRQQYWKDEATNFLRVMNIPPDLYTQDNLARMRRGLSPRDANGNSLELHHPNGLDSDELVPMTREGHRLGTNYLLNHPWLDTKKMVATDIFAYGIGREGRFVAFLEADDDTSWFYLVDRDLDPSTSQIIGAVQVYLGAPDFVADDVKVQWYDDETKVGVFIKGELGAYFDLVAGWGHPGTYWKKHKALSETDDADQRDEQPQTN